LSIEIALFTIALKLTEFLQGLLKEKILEKFRCS